MKITVRRIQAMLDDQDPEAEVAVLIHGYPIPVTGIEEGVVSGVSPNGILYLKVGDDT